MKLVRIMAGIYRSEPAGARIVDRAWERRGPAERWLAEWRVMTLPGIFEKRSRYVPTFKAARALLEGVTS